MLLCGPPSNPLPTARCSLSCVCAPERGDLYQADLREQCFTPAWWALALYAGIMATVYTAGLPLLLTLWLRRYRHKLDSPKALAHVGFLYQTCVPTSYVAHVHPRTACRNVVWWAWARQLAWRPPLHSHTTAPPLHRNRNRQVWHARILLGSAGAAAQAQPQFVARVLRARKQPAGTSTPCPRVWPVPCHAGAAQHRLSAARVTRVR